MKTREIRGWCVRFSLVSNLHYSYVNVASGHGRFQETTIITYISLFRLAANIWIICYTYSLLKKFLKNKCLLININKWLLYIYIYIYNQVLLEAMEMYSSIISELGFYINHWCYFSLVIEKSKSIFSCFLFDNKDNLATLEIVGWLLVECVLHNIP